MDFSGSEANGMIEVSVFKANENVGDLILTITPFTFSQIGNTEISLPRDLLQSRPDPAEGESD